MKLPSAGQLGLLFIVSEVLLGIIKRARAGMASKDAHSLWWLWGVITLSVWLGLWMARHFPRALIGHDQTVAAISVFLFAAGLLLRWFAIVHLGRFFTVNVAIAPDHQLIESGPYRFIRHPSYTGVLVAFLGFALRVGNWLTVVTLMVPIVLVFLYRIKVEERALTAALGEPYRDYSRRTKRLLPFLY